jgi:cytochrome d ubiquinol oxidase subunit I
MNTPAGFRLVAGKPVDISPIAAMMNPAAPGQTIHMLLAAYAAVGFAVAGIHAFLLLRDRRNIFHRHAMAIALAVGGAGAILQPLSGDLLGRMLARYQPVKLAAMEGQFKTEHGAPLRIGGIPDEASATTRYAIEIPYGLSLLAAHDPNAVVKGLEDFPRDLWPDSRWFLRAVVAVSPLGFIAIQAGWTVTEVGRQPWIIQGVMRTAQAVTPMTGLRFTFLTFTLIYIFLAAVVVWLLIRQVAESPRVYAEPAPSDDRGRKYAFN